MKKYAGRVPYVPDVRNLRVSALRQLREPVLAAPFTVLSCIPCPLGGLYLVPVCRRFRVWVGYPPCITRGLGIGTMVHPAQLTHYARLAAYRFASVIIQVYALGTSVVSHIISNALSIAAFRASSRVEYTAVACSSWSGISIKPFHQIL